MSVHFVQEKSGNGPIWYVRFWNEKVGKYTLARSTGIYAKGKKERRREAELKAREMLSEVRFEMEAADRPLISYLEEFWKQDSPYAKECTTIRKNPLSNYYVHQNACNVSPHIKPFPGLNKVTIRGLTSGLIKDWMAWAADRNISGCTIMSNLSQ